MLESMLTQEVQLGFDIATSVTIIGALLSWAWESRRRANKDRQLGLHEQARVASLEKVQHILSEFETSFSDLVQASHSFRAPIRNRINSESENPFERLELYISRKPAVIDEFTELLSVIRNGVDDYYESIQKRRYSLVPVLDSLPGGQQFLADLQQDIKDIGRAHDLINSGYVALLKEFHSLVKQCQEIIDQTEFENPEEVTDEDKIRALLGNKEFRQGAYWLISDKDYDKWISSFVADDKEDEFRRLRDNSALQSNNDLLFDIYVNLASHVVRKPNKLYSQILFMATGEVQSTTIECKDILIKLSALTHKLLVNNNNTDLQKVISLYETEPYLARNTSSR